MRYEKNRRNTFDPIWLEHYQLDATFAENLAKAGFYCIPDGGDSVCFSCGLRKSSFSWGEHRRDPITVHREESTNCDFVNDQSDNVAIDSEQQSNVEFVTYLRSFFERRLTLEEDTTIVSSSTTHHSNVSQEKAKISKSSISVLFHLHFSLEFHLHQVTNSGFVPNEQQCGRTELQNPPKHPEYELESERLSTFSKLGLQPPEVLCEAGFCYTGEHTVELD